MVYSQYTRIYGPYCQKSNSNRQIVILMDESGNKKTVSYPKYIVEKHFNRYLSTEETVDHIDGNFFNNDISNLRIIERKQHCLQDAVRNKAIYAFCAFCGKPFRFWGSTLHHRNRTDKHQSGYFCSRQCCGKYGKKIQTGEIQHHTKPRLEAETFRLKDL